MSKVFISIIVLSAFLSAKAQNSVEQILQLVTLNNTSLRAASDRTEAAKQEARMETSLADPELGFDYLWGAPGQIGHRKDVNITQSLDLATLFGYRRRLARSQQELLDLELQQQQIAKQLEALDLLVQLTCLNQSLALTEERLAQERLLADAYEKRLQAGDANKLEVNRMRLSVADIEADAERLHTERDLLRLDLQTLCADSTIDYQATDYQPLQSLPGFSLRALQQAQMAQQQTVADADLSAARAQSLPTLTAGYMAELTDDEKWRGITVGLSIPLWNNRTNLRRARLQQQSARSEAADAAYQLEQATTAQRLRTERYQHIAQHLEQQLQNASPTALLRKALDEGEISLIEYTLECTDLFDLRLKALEAERDYQQARLQYEALQM